MDERQRTFTVTLDELVAVNNALLNVIGGPYAVEEWEFPALIGVTRDEARAVLAKVGAALDSDGRPRPEP